MHACNARAFLPPCSASRPPHPPSPACHSRHALHCCSLVDARRQVPPNSLRHIPAWQGQGHGTHAQTDSPLCPIMTHAPPSCPRMPQHQGPQDPAWGTTTSSSSSSRHVLLYQGGVQSKKPPLPQCVTGMHPHGGQAGQWLPCNATTRAYRCTQAAKAKPRPTALGQERGAVACLQLAGRQTNQVG